ncbi:MAG: thermonuclease family protein [Myxococcales bacterium]|nr:thermonuclease family protein [Myxococcales bacterium]USN49850.1 MAG: thermonuclease family protein [Myxococcales bacterium]
MRKTSLYLLLVPTIFSSFLLCASHQVQIKTIVKINNETSQVYFNDGDTFKVLDGKYKNERVRIIGFNTLESYGPIHQWENSAPEELYDVAVQATQMARNGSWSCKLEKNSDIYGRLLAQCDDLAKSLIESGLAHAYSAKKKSANKEYLAWQKKAQENRLGMWKKGIPKFIITSLHSVDENIKNQKTSTLQITRRENYNRLISTEDGHTEKMFHSEKYSSCQKICLEENSCMIYVHYRQRYGKNRPDCLLAEQK